MYLYKVLKNKIMFIKKFNLTKASLRSILSDKDSKGEFVQHMFDNIALDYDKMNEIMSFGMNRSIKKQVIRNVPLQSNARILDVCSGTGDIAVFLAKYFGMAGQITGIDFSQNMLNIAKEKAKGFDNIEFMQGDALNLPFEDETFDACFVGYGLRNLVDLKKGISEMKRVTKKGGYVVNLDLGKSTGIFSSLFRLYFFNIVPAFGKIFHGDYTPYRYLPESNESFPSQDQLVSIFKELGFSEVKNYNYVFGTIAQQIAKV